MIRVRKWTLGSKLRFLLGYQQLNSSCSHSFNFIYQSDPKWKIIEILSHLNDGLGSLGLENPDLSFL